MRKENVFHYNDGTVTGYWLRKQITKPTKVSVSRETILEQVTMAAIVTACAVNVILAGVLLF